AKGVVHAAVHLDQTVSNLVKLNTPEGQINFGLAAYYKGKQVQQQWNTGSLNDRAELAGAAGGELLQLFGGEVGKVGEISKIAEVSEDVGKITSVTDKARALGKAGEDAVGITGSKTAINVGGRTRIPDRLTSNFLEEVKNVKYQSFTRQLRDFYQYSQDNGLQMILHTRSGTNTTFSKPLQQLIDNGSIIRQPIPGY
ncbi:MAG: hypothetical protein KGM16_00870, partial [Bacteroidota bacterium]|nr:hypothetical protein [Bacteroidota bacterium]